MDCSWQPHAHCSHQAVVAGGLPQKGARPEPTVGQEAPALPGSLVACSQEPHQAEWVGVGRRPRPVPNSIWSQRRMDFSCYILLQLRPTLPFHPSVTRQVQQQIESLCSRQHIQIQKPTAIIPPAQCVRGWAEGDIGVGWGVWGSQQTCVSMQR